jgi:hypothetical protein
LSSFWPTNRISYQSAQNRWQGKTALEAAQKYAGTVEGPEDLSTNPKYMEGFGK